MPVTSAHRVPRLLGTALALLVACRAAAPDAEESRDAGSGAGVGAQGGGGGASGGAGGAGDRGPGSALGGASGSGAGRGGSGGGGGALPTASDGPAGSAADAPRPASDVRPASNEAGPSDRNPVSSEVGAGTGGKALLVTRPSISKGDDALRRRLTDLGFDVTTVKDTDPAATGTFALIVISEASESVDVGTKYTNHPSPVLVSEPNSLPRFGLTNTAAKTDAQTAIQIGDTQHPIAAGLKGKVEVYGKPATMGNGITPVPSATKVATLDPKAPGAANGFTLLAVEKGAALAGGLVAPARRAFWFLEDDFTADVTPDGWKIFDACVEWLVGRR